MNYQEFKETLIAEIERKISQSNIGVEVVVLDVTKNNNVHLDGITLRNESNVSPTLYANDLFEQYESGVSLEALVKKAVEIARRLPEDLGFDYDKEMNWEQVKDKVVMQVVGTEHNQEIAEGIPCRKEEDLLLAYRVLLSAKEGEMASFQINKQTQSVLGVTEEQLYQAAIKNTPKLLPPQIKDMETIVEEMLSGKEAVVQNLDDMLRGMEKDHVMYVLTNATKNQGAATVFYPEVMEKIAQAFDKDMVVLPSSIHEAILMPYESTMVLPDLKAMVSEINETQVSPEEVLSNQVYVFDKDEKKLVIGDKWNDRKQLKSMGQKESIKARLEAKKEQVNVSAITKKSADVNLEH